MFERWRDLRKQVFGASKEEPLWRRDNPFASPIRIESRLEREQMETVLENLSQQDTLSWHDAFTIVESLSRLQGISRYPNINGLYPSQLITGFEMDGTKRKFIQCSVHPDRNEAEMWIQSEGRKQPYVLKIDRNIIGALTVEDQEACRDAVDFWKKNR